MTISTTTARTTYNGNGITTVFTIPFRFLVNGDIVVVSVSAAGVETTKILTTDYTLTGAGDDAGGSVTMLVAPANGTRLIIYRDTDIVQETDYINGDPFPAETHERALDRLTMIAQEIGSDADRAIKVPVGDSSSLSTTLPAAADRLDKFIVFDATTGATELSTVTQTEVASAVAAAYAAGSTADAVTFLQGGTGAVSRSAQAKLRETVSVKDFGAMGDGTTDDTAATQAAVTAANGSTLIFPEGNYLISSGISFVGWSGVVTGPGTIVCKAATTIAYALDFTDALNVIWNDVSLDMGQTSGTLTGGARSDAGFYIRDARDCVFNNVRITNCKWGEPIYVDGTSSVSPSAADGSKRIFFNNIDCIAISAATVDDGAFINVRSDFYTSDGGGLYAASSNGCKVADYELDASVAYQRTTEDIYFTNCNFENLDRFSGYNVKNLHLSNVSMKGNYTRGLSLSPSCEKVTWNGGKVSGNAAHINANYACSDIVISNLVALGETVVVGQRHALRCGFGSQRIKFSNISGIGCDTRHVFIEGAKDVTFENVSLNQWGGGNTTVAVSIAGGGAANTSTWVTDRIKFIGCDFFANYAFRFDDNAGTATVADGGVVCDETCRFNVGLSFYNGAAPSKKLIYHGSGTWSPTLAGASTAGAQTYIYTPQGRYRRKGDLVFLEASIELSAKDVATAGAVRILGLPFKAAVTINNISALNVGYWQGLTFPANYVQPGVLTENNTTYLRLFRYGSGQAAALVQASEVGGTTALVVSGCYLADN